MRLVTLSQVVGAFFLCSLAPLWGQDLAALESSWTSDLTSTAPSTISPAWLKQLPQDSQKVFAETRFEIIPPPQASDLLVTITFDEQPGGFLKVFWKNSAEAQMLSDNLYEGIEMPNQRTLLISQLTLREKGVLTFQSSQENSHIYKIKWEWLEPKAIAAGGDAFSLAAVDSNGKTLSADETSGDPFLPPSDRWKNSFITAPLIEKPQRIEQGVEFQAELDSVPQVARLEGMLAGLPLGQNLTVWINGHSTSLSLEVPDLTDPGYQGLSSATPSYVGWRKLQLWVPASWLQAGLNKIQFSWENESGTTYPLAVKNLSLQLNFDIPHQPAPAAVPVAESSPLP